MSDPRADDPQGKVEQTPDPSGAPGENGEAQAGAAGTSGQETFPSEAATPDEPPPEAAGELPAAAPEEPPPAQAAAAPQASRGRSLGVALGMLALLVAFAAAGGVVFTWWQVAEQREAVAGQRAETTATLSDIRGLVAATQARMAVQEERLGQLNNEIDERQRELEGMDAELRQARARLEALMREDAGAERSPTLAEIEFLLSLANRELTLADNPRVALAALREADQRVARLDDPGLAEVRAAIHDEIAAVEAVADLDPDGIMLRIASLARRVEGLPLRASLAPDPRRAAEADDESTGWTRLTARMRSAAASLFRIRRTDEPAAPLLAPDESFFLYRNVELDLKSARLAVAARDQENYAASLEAAHHTLVSYFETGDDEVQALLGAIGELEQRDIAPAWPGISRSLALLRSSGALE